MIKFSDRLQQLRKERGLTQQMMEEKTGIQQATLSSYENDRYEPGIEAMAKLAEALGCEIADFFPRESEAAKPVFAVNDGVSPLSKEERELVEYYRGVTHPKEKKAIKDMAQLLAAKRAS